MSDTQKVIAEMRFLASGAAEKDILEWASRLEAEQKREPVAVGRVLHGTLVRTGIENLPDGTTLYTHPPADAGMVMVPREPTIEMVEAFYRAYERSLSPDRWESHFGNAWEAMIVAAKGE